MVLNLGLEQVKSEYIYVLGDDDVVLALDKSITDDLVSLKYDIYACKVTTTTKTQERRVDIYKTSGTKMVVLELLVDYGLASSGRFIKKKLPIKFSEDYSIISDNILFYSLIHDGHIMGYNSNSIARFNDTGISSNNNYRWNEWLRFMEGINIGRYDKHRESYISIFLRFLRFAHIKTLLYLNRTDVTVFIDDGIVLTNKPLSETKELIGPMSCGIINFIYFASFTRIEKDTEYKEALLHSDIYCLME